MGGKWRPREREEEGWAPASERSERAGLEFGLRYRKKEFQVYGVWDPPEGHDTKCTTGVEKCVALHMANMFVFRHLSNPDGSETKGTRVWVEVYEKGVPSVWGMGPRRGSWHQVHHRCRKVRSTSYGEYVCLQIP